MKEYKSKKEEIVEKIIENFRHQALIENKSIDEALGFALEVKKKDVVYAESEALSEIFKEIKPKILKKKRAGITTGTK